MNEPQHTWRVVIIEDSPHDRSEVKAALLRGSIRRYEIAEAETGAEGLALCRSAPLPDCVLLDYILPDMTALELLAALPQKANLPALPVVIFTGSADSKINTEVLRAGAQGFVGKNWMTPDSLTRVVENAVERHAMLAELRRTSEALAQREALLRSVADATDNVIFAKDLEGRYILVNRAWRELFGVSEGEGMTDEQIAGPELAALLRANDREVMASGQIRQFEERVRLPGRGEVTYQSSKAPLLDLAGNVVGVCGVSTDLTSLKAAEAALRESEHRLRLTLEGAEMGMWDWDLGTGMVSWSPECYAIHGLGVDDFDGTAAGFDRLVHRDDVDRVWATVRAAAAGRRTYDAELRIVRPGGEVRWVTNKGRALYDAEGNPTRMIGIIADVTDAKQIEAEREQLLAAEQAARAESERVAWIKDEFLATLSHELRTPLNAIVGWAQILQRTDTSNESLIREGVKVIARNADSQAQLISDLLDMNRIVSGKLKMEVGPLDPNLVAAGAADTVHPTAVAKGVILDLRLGRELPQINGDEGRLRQVLWNLLTNAIKFTPAGGGITLSTEASAGMVQLIVEDTGQGLDPEFVPRLFNRFSQADASAARKHGGLGLGLSIVKQLVELHGGTIQAESEGPGRGSRFTISLPARTPPPVPEPSVPAKIAEEPGLPPELPHMSLSGISVLLVDDQLDTLEAARRLLTEYGASVATVTSGRQALEQLRRLLPDVLLSDIGMPEMDGYRLIREVRESLGLGSAELPAVALTAFARHEDRDRALAAGYQAHVAKPLRPHSLIATVAALARSRREKRDPG